MEKNWVGERFLDADGERISIRHPRRRDQRVIIVAPGFFQSKETPTFRRIEADLLERFDVVSMDFRGHGKSSGLYTFSAKEPEDLRAVVEYAREHYAKVGVLGFSYGGAIALIQQAANRNCDSILCVSSPMASDKIEFKWWLPASMQLGLKGLEAGAGARFVNPWIAKKRSIDIVDKIGGLPVFFVHGEDDPTVGPGHSREMHAKAKNPKKIKIWPKASHAEEIYRQYPSAFIETVVGWFDSTL